MKSISEVIVGIIMCVLFGGFALYFSGWGIVLIVVHLWPAPGTRNDLGPFGALVGLVSLAIGVILMRALVQAFSRKRQ